MTEFQPNTHILEPVRRPDGHTVEVLSGDNADVIRFEYAGISHLFAKSVVTGIGDGDYQYGLTVIGQTCFSAGTKNPGGSKAYFYGTNEKSELVQEFTK